MAPQEGAPAHGNLAHLLPPGYKRLVSAWLEEDAPSLDYGGFVVGDAPSEARLLGKSKGILAGVPFVDEVFRQLDCTVEWHIIEGTSFDPITHCATVRGPIRNLLLGERVAINTLARCSGIATQSARLLARLRAGGFSGTLAGTRKTTPGFRVVEKYGMLAGGCDPHRMDLSQMVMLKDNHVEACSDGAADDGIGGAVRAARAAAGFAVKIEVECRSVEQAHAAGAAGADVVMLDNFTPEGVRAAARSVKERWGHRVLIEVSGGLTEDNVEGFVSNDVDIVSSSSIHQGVKHVDFSLKVVPRMRN